MRNLTSAFTLAICTGISGSAFAHSGHGSTSSLSPVHYLAEPVHMAALLVALAVVVVVVRNRAQRPAPVRVEK